MRPLRGPRRSSWADWSQDQWALTQSGAGPGPVDSRRLV